MFITSLLLLLLLLLVLCTFNPISPAINLYETQPIGFDENLRYNCLLYSSRTEWDLTLNVEYCFRPSNNRDNWSLEGFLSNEHQKYTFDQLFRLNITTNDLRSWSISTDSIEEYQHFLHQRDVRSATKEIVRCHGLWFGPKCQYSFNISNGIYFTNLVERNIRTKMKTKSLNNESYGTCYPYLNCTVNGIPICLDWRQICDRRIDCFDGEQDEALCFNFEMNECQKNEFRCHNGQCIDQEFSHDEMIECFDRTDDRYQSITSDSFIDMIDLIWAEHGCRPGSTNFLCGDGKCVRDFQLCQNGRHENLFQAISTQSTLETNCWKSLLCLTKIVSEIDKISCQRYILSIETCDSLIIFPIRPILLHHIQFLYDRNHLDLNQSSQAAIPTYICYDLHLCEHLHPTFHHQNLTCRHASLMGFNKSSYYPTWISVVNTIRPYIVGCMLPSEKYTSSDSHPSLYCCQNSSKCISQHRLIDGIIDCPHQDDEQAVGQSCSIPHPDRFQCHNEQQCRSPLFSPNICPPLPYRELKQILFHEICDRVQQTLPQLFDGRNHTDETECDHWPCSNIYTRCDYFWNCVNGRDEYNCSSFTLTSTCPPSTLQCLSLLNYSIICLPGEQVEDGVMDCLGGADEQAVCREESIGTSTYWGFTCVNESICLSGASLCDGYDDCPLGDDELFCGNRSNICSKEMILFHTDADKIICRLDPIKKYVFSYETLPAYPILKNEVIPLFSPSINQTRSSTNVISSTAIDLSHVWYCHRGIAVRVRLNETEFGTRCLCPSTLFGDRCEYQSQRVSITLKVYPVRKRDVQSFLITLISDDIEDIQSYHQARYVLEDSCGKTFKFLLLFSNRPKNLSKNYFVKIDAFNQTTLKYVASWRYPVPFSFLPVNPVTILIRIPTESIISSGKCRLDCGNHGRCWEFLNEKSSFCRCNVGWTGKTCDQRVNCDDCASDSLCVGSYENQSICMCPVNGFGRRCLAKYSCEQDLCANNGTCLVTDENDNQDSFACVCPEGFYGIFCQFTKSVLHLSFKNMKIPSYILFNVFYSNIKEFSHELPKLKLFVHKMRMFQQSITLYVDEPFQIVVVRANEYYYLAVLQELYGINNISTTISPTQQCPFFKEIAARHLVDLPEIRRVKYYHQLCQLNSKLMCFVDDSYLCLCTIERHANCLPFEPSFTCQEDLHCENGAKCFQDHFQCPKNTFCICSDCFYGDRCQYYSKGIGLTLDDLLRYELRPSVDFNHQSAVVKVSAVISSIILIAGLINSFLSLLTFHTGDSRRVGTGMYLFASSITSLLTVSLFNIKFWFLIITHIRSSTTRTVLRSACVGLEPLLKLCLFTDSWLNASVAIERAISVYKGVKFNRTSSKCTARWVIGILPIMILFSLVHEFVYRDLSDDEEEQRIWCVFTYSKPIIAYNTFILSLHTLGHFIVNLFSTIVIITGNARRKAQAQQKRSYLNHLLKQIKEHRHLIMSPLILTILSLPRIAISLFSGCVKANRNPWLYLSVYFISFIPSVIVFVIFVVPSPLYREQFSYSTKLLQRRIPKLTFFPPT